MKLFKVLKLLNGTICGCGDIHLYFTKYFNLKVNYDAPYGVLGLEAEEEAGGEAYDVVHAGDVLLPPLLVQVAMGEDHQVPDHSEHRPGDQERGGEAQQRPRPGKVNHGGEKVLQKPETKTLRLNTAF